MQLNLIPTIDPLVLAKIMHWVRRADSLEVSGFGKVVPGPNGPHVASAILLEQENSFAVTEIDPMALAKAMYQTKDEPGDLNFWWHSHGHGDVFWSGTDQATMRQIGSNGYLLSSVFNIYGKVRTAVFMAKPFPIFADELELTQRMVLDAEYTTAWEADYVAKVTETRWVASNARSEDWRRKEPTRMSRHERKILRRRKLLPVATEMPYRKDEANGEASDSEDGWYFDQGVWKKEVHQSP